MRVYLDASILVAYFIPDAFTDRARRFLYSELPQAIVSDFAATEFSSAIAHRMRTKRLTSAEARAAFLTLDAWLAWAPNRSQIEPADLGAAATILRRLDLNIRTGDALNIAIAQRFGATLATFDERMAENARALGVSVAAA